MGPPGELVGGGLVVVVFVGPVGAPGLVGNVEVVDAVGGTVPKEGVGRQVVTRSP